MKAWNSVSLTLKKFNTITSNSHFYVFLVRILFEQVYNESSPERNVTLVYLTSLLFDFLPFFHLIWLAQTVLYKSKRVNLYLMTFKLLLQTPFTLNTLLSVCLQWLPSYVSKHKGNLRFRMKLLHQSHLLVRHASEVCRTMSNKMYWYAFDQWVLAASMLLFLCRLISCHIFCSCWSLFFFGHQIHRG